MNTNIPVKNEENDISLNLFVPKSIVTPILPIVSVPVVPVPVVPVPVVPVPVVPVPVVPVPVVPVPVVPVPVVPVPVVPVPVVPVPVVPVPVVPVPVVPVPVVPVLDISLNYDINKNIKINSSSTFSIIMDNSLNQTILDISTLLQMPIDASINSYNITISGEIETIIYQELVFNTDFSGQIQITEDLDAIIQTYNDETDPSLNTILQEIIYYAGQINCSNFQGKGSINDYAELFTIASNLANEAKQTTLMIDISRFHEFGKAADELSNVFQHYILKLKNINVVNDIEFLKSIKESLYKISNLANVFGKFKETILATSIVEIPKSLEDTKLIIDGVMTEVNCAMKYINHFICPENDISMCASSSLSKEEQKLIASAIDTIKNWDNKYNKNLQVILSENADVQFIEAANKIIANTAKDMKNATSIFKGKISILCCKNT